MISQDYESILYVVANPVIVFRPVYGTDTTVTDFYIEYVNPAYTVLTHNLTKAGDMFSSFSALMPAGIDWFRIACETAKEGKTTFETYHSNRTGTWFQMTMERAENGMCVATLGNITDLKEKEQNLHKLAYHDMLTGIPNRAFFNRIFQRALDAAAANSKKVGLLLIDIDDLKAINDISGHSAGDAILKKCAELLSCFKKNGMQPFRLGDDEYLLLIKNVESANELMNISDAVFETLQNNEIYVSAGTALFPDDGTEPSKLLREADLAMHLVKRNGKNNIAAFEPKLYSDFCEKNSLKMKLREAVLSGAFELYYQPQFDIHKNFLRGFEALLRWHDPQLGWIKPDTFIPVAEETHDILPLSSWVLETAVKTLHIWQQDFGFTGILSVNISPSQLKKNSFAFDLFNLLDANEIKEGSFEIEITEGVFINNMEQAVETLKRIRDRGILISLDDFGTGYSSYRYLQELPLSTLKIDKTFMDGLCRSISNRNIIDSIISLAADMGLETIAEGIETEVQLDTLKEMPCSTIQGFLRGKPMDEKKCEKLLQGDHSVLETTE